MCFILSCKDAPPRASIRCPPNQVPEHNSRGASGPGSQSGAELKDADAESWHIKDVITHGNFTSTIGLRYEDVEYNKGTMGSPGSTGTETNDETMLGLSTVYSFPNDVQMFGWIP